VLLCCGLEQVAQLLSKVLPLLNVPTAAPNKLSALAAMGLNKVLLLLLNKLLLLCGINYSWWCVA
jgi:hypothetical protein